MRFKIFSKYKFNCYIIIIFDEILIVYKVLFLFLLVNFGWFVNLDDIWIGWGVLSGNLDYK